VTARPGPNDVLPCGTESALRRHQAHGRICPVCQPEEPWFARCPLCLNTVTAVGVVVQGHRVSGRGFGFAGFACPGEGVTVPFPAWSNPVGEAA
jgi:hypothetical protein